MRCNAGVDPKYLTDQWLIAEQVELLMIPGMLKKNNCVIKTKVPEKFKLGTGHMVFWCDKLVYLKRRHAAVKKEVARRGFKVADREINLSDFPKEFHNDWKPTMEDSKILRDRLKWKLEQKPDIWRYKRDRINNVLGQYKDTLLKSNLYYV